VGVDFKQLPENQMEGGDGGQELSFIDSVFPVFVFSNLNISTLYCFNSASEIFVMIFI
jgi:hypothetical protein